MVRKKSKFIINQEASGLLSRLGIRTPKLINYGLIKEKNYNSLIQKWLDDNNILIYSTHNKGKSVVAERFIRTLKGKIYRKITGNDSQSYLGYLNKLLDENNNNYRYFTGKRPIHADYSALTQEIESSHKTPKFKIGDRVRITKYRNFVRKVYTKNWAREIFVIDCVLKTNPWAYRTKDSNREKVKINFYEKELL